MRLGPILIVTLLLVTAAGIGFYLLTRKPDGETERSGEPPIAAEKPVFSDMYVDLRDRALHLTAADLEVQTGPEETHAVVVDWNIGSGIVTLVALKTGDASIYFSSGGGIIGGGQHDRPRSLARELVADSGDISKSILVEFDSRLPDEDEVKFHILRGSGTKTATATIPELEGQGSELTDFFDKANLLIAELRRTAEENS